MPGRLQKYTQQPLVGQQAKVPIYREAPASPLYTQAIQAGWPEEPMSKTIDAREHDIPKPGMDAGPWHDREDTLKALYGIVRGRASGAKLLVTPDQIEAIYFALAGFGDNAWTEPNCIPADYRIGSLKFEVVES